MHEGDYDGLIKVMEYLALVASKQKETDKMFGPLQETIDMLRQYGIVIPNESIAQLEDLPEKGRSNIKKCEYFVLTHCLEKAKRCLVLIIRFFSIQSILCCTEYLNVRQWANTKRLSVTSRQQVSHTLHL